LIVNDVSLQAYAPSFIVNGVPLQAHATSFVMNGASLQPSVFLRRVQDTAAQRFVSSRRRVGSAFASQQAPIMTQHGRAARRVCYDRRDVN
jgi:hypothetical protein